MTLPSRRKPRTTAFRGTRSRTAISLGLLAALAAPAFAQVPATKPTIPWTPYTQAPPTTPTVPSGTVSAAPISTQPGLVPQTLTYQKNVGVPAVQPALPPLGVPAIPTSIVRTPAVEVPPIEIEKSTVKYQAEPSKAVPLPGALPSRDDVFRLDGDSVLNRRIQRELGDKKDEFPLPNALLPAGATYTPKTAGYPPVRAKLEPTYVIHRRLYFEDTNAERAGWDMGPVQPIFSAAWFVRDVVLLPHNVASGFWKNRWDTSAGKCPPGAPTPYYLYPRGYTVSGLLWEVPLVVGLTYIFP